MCETMFAHIDTIRMGNRSGQTKSRVQPTTQRISEEILW